MHARAFHVSMMEVVHRLVPRSCARANLRTQVHNVSAPMRVSEHILSSNDRRLSSVNYCASSPCRNGGTYVRSFSFWMTKSRRILLGASICRIPINADVLTVFRVQVVKCQSLAIALPFHVWMVECTNERRRWSSTREGYFGHDYLDVFSIRMFINVRVPFRTQDCDANQISTVERVSVTHGCRNWNVSL
jgi:hypothetical protein